MYNNQNITAQTTDIIPGINYLEEKQRWISGADDKQHKLYTYNRAQSVCLLKPKLNFKQGNLAFLLKFVISFAQTRGSRAPGDSRIHRIPMATNYLKRTLHLPAVFITCIPGAKAITPNRLFPTSPNHNANMHLGTSKAPLSQTTTLRTQEQIIICQETNKNWDYRQQGA